MNTTERFLSFVSFGTNSDEDSTTFPSTPNQKNLGAEIVRQMLELGIEDAAMDEFGYVTGTIPANTDRKIPVYGLIAHMDTSPDVPGDGIRPRITEVYDGGDILLNAEKGIVLSPADFPALKNHVGKHLIVTDGTTLLGADDKAGIAAILSAAEILLHTDREHGKIRLGFTPDEEIGRGTEKFDVKAFGADYAYTVDGGSIGCLEYENFNAANAKILIHGRSVHPGSAKNKMKNAVLMAMELNALLPSEEIPAKTSGHEGFYHLGSLTASVEQAEMRYVIRDHDMEIFRRRKKVVEDAVAAMNEKYGSGTVTMEMHDSYYNMKEKLADCMFLIEDAKRVMERMSITPRVIPIRGGTDGAKLSYAGLPCPNLGAGTANGHGRFEYVPMEDLEKNGVYLSELMLEAAK